MAMRTCMVARGMKTPLPLAHIGAVDGTADAICGTQHWPPGSAPPDPQPSIEENQTLAEKWLGAVPSVFSFASADLESAYHKYLLSTAAWPAIGLCVPLIFGWLAFFQKLYYAAGVTFGYPTLLDIVLVATFNVAPVLALAVAILLCPKIYTTHFPVVNFFVQVSSLGVSNIVRSAMIWACTIAQGAPHTVSAFMVENFFLTQSLRVLFMPSSQACDLALMTAIFLLHLNGNSDICDKWGSEMVTLSLPVTRVTQSLSNGVLASLGSPALWAPEGLPRVQSCAAVLAFWEVVGWWAAAMLVLVHEVMRRRAFLASNARLLEPHNAEAKKRWPLGSPVMLTNCIAAVVGTYIVAAITWAVYVSVDR